MMVRWWSQQMIECACNCHTYGSELLGQPGVPLQQLRVGVEEPHGPAAGEPAEQVE